MKDLCSKCETQLSNANTQFSGFGAVLRDDTKRT